MNKQILLHNFISSELLRYKALENKFKQDLAIMPIGSITKTGDGNFYRVYRKSGKQIKRKLTSSDARLFDNLQRKRQAKAALPLISNKISLYEKWLDEDLLYDPCKIHASLPEQYQNPRSSYLFLKDDFNPDTWHDAFSGTNDFHKENLIHVTESGVKTRSKSEAIIGTQLERSNIDYHYEPRLDLGFRVVYPDFAIFIPESRKVIFWEHFGLVDDPEYMMAALRKIDDYIKAGYYPGINLIITYETREQPLTIIAVNNKIREILAM